MSERAHLGIGSEFGHRGFRLRIDHIGESPEKLGTPGFRASAQGANKAAAIGIGARGLSPGTPATPPDKRVRIRRFGAWRSRGETGKPHLVDVANGKGNASLASARSVGSRVRTRVPSARSCPSARCRASPSALPRSAPASGFRPCARTGARVASTSVALCLRDSRPFRSPLRSVLRRGRPRLLRPLLTSRSASRRDPFRSKARSPQVRTRPFAARPPDIRRLSLDHRSFAVRRLLAPLGTASHRVLVHRPAASLHASSPRSVALPQLRFASIEMVSFRRDFHPLGHAHAGRTSGEARTFGADYVVEAGCGRDRSWSRLVGPPCPIPKEAVSEPVPAEVGQVSHVWLGGSVSEGPERARGRGRRPYAAQGVVNRRASQNA